MVVLRNHLLIPKLRGSILFMMSWFHESYENSGFDILNCVPRLKIGMSVVFERFLFHNWHLSDIENLF